MFLGIVFRQITIYLKKKKEKLKKNWMKLIFYINQNKIKLNKMKLNSFLFYFSQVILNINNYLIVYLRFF
jgi:hypothetical protein